MQRQFIVINGSISLALQLPICLASIVVFLNQKLVLNLQAVLCARTLDSSCNIMQMVDGAMDKSRSSLVYCVTWVGVESAGRVDGCSEIDA